MSELSGRTVQYGYDDVYRLTGETISGAVAQGSPAAQNGAIAYQYDAVGNRLALNSTLPAVPTGMLNYDANDRLTTDTYDANGNTVSSAGLDNTYDFENHLVQHGAVSIVYDGDGNRVAKTAGGVTTQYLVDTNNPTGYAQVLDEIQAGKVTRTYTYGLDRISENQPITSTSGSTWQLSYYGYDGHGSVRYLMNTAGAVTDTYDYDAFGNLISSTGTTPNNYLYSGEQYDPDLHLYYNRARYLNVRNGRFWGMDTYEGDPESPQSLHRYLYVSGKPITNIDPSGLEGIDEEEAAAADGVAIDSMPQITFRNVIARVYTSLNSLPMLVERGLFWFAAATAGLDVLSKGVDGISRLASNVAAYNGEQFPRGNFPRGIFIGEAAGQNLGNGFPVFDNFNNDTGEGTQIFSTTQVDTPDAFVRAVRAKAWGFQQGFESREMFSGVDNEGRPESFL